LHRRSRGWQFSENRRAAGGIGKRLVDRRRGGQTPGHFLERARKFGGPESWQSQALFSSVDGGQPKAAIFDRQAKERGNWQAGQSPEQAKASSIGQMRIAEHQINRA
jgi:hypothetical protein